MSFSLRSLVRTERLFPKKQVAGSNPAGDICLDIWCVIARIKPRSENGITRLYESLNVGSIPTEAN